MTGPVGNGYKAITFSDKQNGQAKTYQLPIGTKIGVTDNSYEVKKDGLYLNNKKLDNATVNVILPQLSAVSVWDANKDSKLNKQDIKRIEDFERRDSDYIGDKISNALRNSNSKYHVAQDGGGYWTTAYDNMLSATFETAPWFDESGTRQVRDITIEFPEK